MGVHHAPLNTPCHPQYTMPAYHAHSSLTPPTHSPTPHPLPHQHLGSDSAPITKVGTAAYVAPEVIHNSESRTMYDGTKADIWSAGVVLFVLLCGRYPFTGGTVDHNVAVSMVANLTQVRRGVVVCVW